MASVSMPNGRDEMIAHECIRCGVTFAIGRNYDDRRRQDGFRFKCPNGHSQGYKGSVTLAVIEELKREKASVEAELRRLRQNFVAGRCPVCDRVLSNITMHLHNAHFQLANEWSK
jgi:hypothetical protein